jgi:hypothetical protein
MEQQWFKYLALIATTQSTHPLSLIKQRKTEEKIRVLPNACGTSSSRDRRQLTDPASTFQLAARIAETPLFIGTVHQILWV